MDYCHSQRRKMSRAFSDNFIYKRTVLSRRARTAGKENTLYMLRDEKGNPPWKVKKIQLPCDLLCKYILH